MISINVIDYNLKSVILILDTLEHDLKTDELQKITP